MRPLNNRLKIIQAGAMLLIMFVMVGLQSAASHGAFWDKVQDAPVTEVTPGLVVCMGLYGI